MITKDEIQELLHSTETYRVERTTSTDERSKSRGHARLDYALQGGRRREPTGDMDKFQEAICAFANDLPNSRKKGYLILGAYDNGGNVGGKNGGKVGGDVPSLSPALSQVLSPDEEKDASTDAKDTISSSKVATLDEKVASSEPKVVTSEEKVASPKKKISSEEMAIYILEYCDTWRSMDEIAQFANRDKNYIRNKVLPRLAEKLEKEHPDIPNHPRQRYRTIAKK